MTNKRTLEDRDDGDAGVTEGGDGKKLRGGPSAMKVQLSADTVGSITKEEVDLYDRQIRLWGLEAQQRMRNAKILVAGVNGLSNEVCKNVVLAGVGAITIMDEGSVSEEDLGAQFFLRENDVGKSRAEAAVHRMHDLNPRVACKAVVDNVASQPDEFFNQFDIVCLSGFNREAMIRVNNVCREKGIKFWATGTAGFRGYMFADLMTHSYIETQKIMRKGKPDQIKEKQCVAKFVSFEDVLKAGWHELEGMKEKRKRDVVHPSYFGFSLLWEYWNQYARLPNPNSATDADTLVDMKEQFMTSVGANPTFLPDDLLRSFAQTARAEVSPVCAVVGGLLGAEILKVLSGKGEPINNFFAYDAFEPSGKILRIPNPEFGKGKQVAQASTEEVDLIND
ncbi:SUMO-activating enzyme subunit 1 [Borealophlyctis nickersoniae]|nr:SUMO-activating enzyme subunit 1 [Borealophlyctis nickersoniae]